MRAKRSAAEWWDPGTGKVTPASIGETVTFEPYGSRLLVLYDGSSAGSAHEVLVSGASTQHSVTLGPWNMRFPGSAGSKARPTEDAQSDTLWTDQADTRFYSGEVVYATRVELPSAAEHERVTLQFAPSIAIPDNQMAGKPGMRAWLDPPIHEAAIVFVNGRKAGAVWHPPYSLDLSGLLHVGENTAELHVYNTAINELAAHSPRDYGALKARYGDRFQMQDMENLEPVPSGIRGPVQLRFGITTAAAHMGDAER